MMNPRIPGMLLRAIGSRRQHRNRDLTVHVVTQGKDEALERRYRQLFPNVVKFHRDGHRKDLQGSARTDEIR